MTTERFFDDYPQFYETSQTAADAERLHGRYRAIIDDNRAILEDGKILDIASHDGRWSFAALTAGARHVTGIEIRRRLVENSVENLRSQGFQDDQFHFILGDALDQLSQLEPGQFDAILCLGYLYHTLHIPKLIHQIGRLRPKHVIIDTAVGVPVGFHEPPSWSSMSGGAYGKFFVEKLCEFLSDQPLIVLRGDDTRCEGMAVDPENQGDNEVLVGYPSKGAIELLLGKAGFERFVYYNWREAEIRDWSSLWDYCQGYRVTMRCSAKSIR